MRKRKFERITPTLREELHWLPVPERIVFKLCVIIFKYRHQTAPQYPQELCIPVTASTSRRHLRCAPHVDLQVLACRTSGFGARSFAACAPKLWNFVPSSLRDPTLTLTLYCSRLKAHLFGLAYGRALVTAQAVRAARYKCSHTYTHTCMHAYYKRRPTHITLANHYLLVCT